MEDNIISLKNNLIKALEGLGNENWQTVEMTIDFPPFINRAYSGSQTFKDKSGVKVKLVLFGDLEFQNSICKFIYEVNQNDEYNQILFFANRADYKNAQISLIFNQEIEDNFQNNLPKSKKGKTIPWWKIESETIGLGEN